MSKLKIAVLGTWVPAKEDMKPEQAKYYKNLDVFSYSMLPISEQNRTKPEQHEALVTFAASRPIWDWEIHCIECLNCKGQGKFEWFMKAMNYCRDYIHPDLINASLGWSCLEEYRQLEMEHISKQLLLNNCVLFAAGGNEGYDPVTGGINPDSVCWPAALPQWIASGSAEDGERSYFSSVGDAIMFVMDGNEEKGINLDGVETWSGTSLSSPKLAGLCARLMMEVDKLPITITNRQEWLLGMLPFLARHKYEDKLNKFDMLQKNDKVGYGSVEWLYDEMLTSYDLFMADNVAGTLRVGLQEKSAKEQNSKQ